MNQCLMGCGESQECADNCFSSATEQAYDLYVEVANCVFGECPDPNDLACQNAVLGEGGACADLWEACTGGGTTTTGACDPAEHPEDPNYCYTCSGALTCLQGCGADVACGQACIGRATAAGQALFQAIGTCLLAECEDPNDLACQNAALTGACSDELAACMAAKSARSIKADGLLSGLRRVARAPSRVVAALALVSEVGLKVRKLVKND